jgi:hypothetical protein
MNAQAQAILARVLSDRPFDGPPHGGWTSCNEIFANNRQIPGPFPIESGLYLRA